jgi:uncharacterized damage-inducible protein DinB
VIRPLLVPLAFLLGTRLLAAQATAPGFVRADWERDRRNVLAYVDAMPDSALTFRPTPGVRTFAQQVQHILESDLDVAAIALLGESGPPVLGDSTQYLHHKAALHAYTAAAFDYILSAIARATAAQWQRRSQLYRQPAQLPERWFELAHEHSIWTLGQVVPYLRLNGVTPPPYDMPF